ncbi:hypothetical protein LPW11_07185 [Geomonas sp. RF6]|uniref:MXAN_5187 C-terminal domain-containing protein n=1 Tax=Geomonas sp. RF6 TaxID=2897342 RepID=UPI001E3A8918|nr:MXAN_5187 C-terminal domain-containing protein [Geomonas sp. RF6]UFS71967.1 hypothetical protein LPW11_07185 [Geomonas sp. RF6]
MGLPEDITRLEQLLHELVVKYEQYFVGIEKREPLILLAEVEQLARRYQNISITNTMLRYKYNSLIATFSVHRQKWNRITRLIDEGRYERDRFKMALHSREGGAGTPTPSSTPPSSAQPKGGVAEGQLEKLYQDYIEARRLCNLPTESVSRDKVLEAVTRQVPGIIKKYGCSEVEMRVVVEDGKPRIKVRGKNP